MDNDDETSADATQIFDSVSYFFFFGFKRKFIFSTVIYFKVESALEEVTVTEVSPDLQFFVQKVKDSEKLTSLMGKVSSHVKSAMNSSLSFKPKRNDICASK